MTVTKFAYTLSSRRGLAEDAIQSIKSLLYWVDPGQVVVYYTPPRRDEHRRTLNELGVNVRETDNQTPAFAMGEARRPSHYGEKVQICGLDADTVVFLDCDTVVLDDPARVLAGEFDFKARPGTYPVDPDDWRDLYQRYGKEYLDWMPNAGFLVFKNRTHQKIQSDWKRYIDEDIELPSTGPKHAEQYALALAVSSYETVKMTPSEHVMRWAGEAPADGVMFHGDPPSGGESAPSAREYAKRAVGQLLRGNI